MCEPSNLKFVHALGIFGRGGVHRVGDGVDNDVDHKLSGLFDVSEGVFALIADVAGRRENDMVI